MASRNIAESKRFVYRSPDRKLVAYVSPINKSRSYVTSRVIHSHVLPAKRKLPPPPRSPLPLFLSNRLSSPLPFQKSQPLSPPPYQKSKPSSPLSYQKAKRPSPPPPERQVNADTPRADVAATRRVVVVRTKNNRPANQGSENLSQEDSVTIPIVTSTGNRSIHFIRRPILSSEQEESINQTNTE